MGKWKLLEQINVLFLLFLRDPKLWKVSTEEDLVKYLTRNGKLIKIDVEECTRILLHSKGFQIAFVLDGLDEFPRDKDQFIVNLIKEKHFPRATVVCTSRPNASLFLHDFVHRRINILGFNKEERKNYITIALLKFPEKHKQIIKYLKDNPMIDDLCFIPLHLAILLYFFQCQNTLPETLTELNELFIIHTVYRSLKNSHDSNAPNLGVKLRDLLERVSNVVDKLCKLAYEGVKSHQMIFTSDEIKKICPEISDYPDGFGLMEVVSHYCTTAVGETNSYSFLHFTMQEFLAAHHVSTLTSNEQLDLLHQTFWDSFFGYMWVMYVGIVGIHSEAFSKFIGSLLHHSDLSRHTVK